MTEEKQKLINLYKQTLVEKIGVEVDDLLLEKIVNRLGPSIFDANSSLVASTKSQELDRVKKKWLVDTLNFDYEDDLDGIINQAVEKYGRSEKNKHRAVLYYLITTQQSKEDEIIPSE